MLRPNDCFTGSITDAEPLSLVLPCSKRGETFLIGGPKDEPRAIFLSGKNKFHFYVPTAPTPWEGLIIPGVRLEIDETSIVDGDGPTKSPGVLIRTGQQLRLICKPDHLSTGLSKIVLYDQLSAGNEIEAIFENWRIVVDDHYDTRVLWEAKPN